jgi:outer membrane protein OmpA-like peptidoglycan-associated protein
VKNTLFSSGMHCGLKLALSQRYTSIGKLKDLNMTSAIKKALLASAILVTCFGTAAQAQVKDTVTDKRANIVVNTFGNCVRTKWDSATDACAQPVAATPAPVAAPAPQPVAQLSQEARTIYFDFNKDALTAESVQKLDTLSAAVLASKGVVRADIVGYADEIGSDSYNVKLSERRSHAVKKYLDGKINIPTEVTDIRGLGESNSVTDCKKIKARKAKIACLAKDRRVEVQFQYQQ